MKRTYATFSRLIVLIGVCAASLAAAATASAIDDTLQHASRTTGLPGSPANGISTTSHEAIGVNSDGHTLVAFSSFASNLGSTLNYQAYVRNLTTGEVTRASKTTNGDFLDSDADNVAISGNGRYVVFQSSGAYAAGDTDGEIDIFRHDLQTGETINVSVPSGGNGDRASERPSISHDGNVIAFYSSADLVPADDSDPGNTTDFDGDIYARNVSAGTTTLISVNSAGSEVPNDLVQPEASVSGDGQIVAFVSDGDLSPNDSSSVGGEVYVRSVDGTTPTEAVSLTDGEASPSDGSFSTMPAVDFDGSHIAFKSNAMNLTGLPYFQYNIIVRDRDAGTTQIASLAAADSPGDENAIVDLPAISDDGRYVSFETEDTSFAAGTFEDVVEIYLRDMALPYGAALISKTPDGTPGNDGSSYNSSVSPDGSAVAFTANMSNLLSAFGASTAPAFSQVFIGGAGEQSLPPTGGGPGGENPSPPPVATPFPPTVAKPKLAKKKFKAGKKLGTKLTLTAGEAGTLTGTYMKGKKKAGGFTAKLKAGKNTVKVTGLVKRKKLKAGSYKLRLTLKSAATGLISKPVTLSFKITR